MAESLKAFYDLMALSGSPVVSHETNRACVVAWLLAAPPGEGGMNAFRRRCAAVGAVLNPDWSKVR